MQTKKYKIVKAKQSKNIAIIGAGIAGLEAALVLAKRGHNVTIYEKSDKVGGVFIAASVFSFKEKDRALLEWYKKQIANEKNIKIEFNKEIKSLSEIQADEYIVATGSTPRKLDIPGSDKFIDACTYLLNQTNVGDNVTIIGGGLTGCEIAYELHLQGRHPTIVEAKNDLIAVKGVCLANSSYLRDYFKLHDVPVYLNSTVKEYKDGEVVIKYKDDEFKVKTDNVVVSIGYNSYKLVEKEKHVHIIGDANKVGNLRTAIWGAWDVAMKL